MTLIKTFNYNASTHTDNQETYIKAQKMVVYAHAGYSTSLGPSHTSCSLRQTTLHLSWELLDHFQSKESQNYIDLQVHSIHWCTQKILSSRISLSCQAWSSESKITICSTHRAHLLPLHSIPLWNTQLQKNLPTRLATHALPWITTNANLPQ